MIFIYLSDLIRGEFYKIRIAAKTNDGTGTFSKWRVAQTKENKRAKDKVTTSSTTPSPTTTLYGVTTGLPTTTGKCLEVNPNGTNKNSLNRI